MQVLPSVDIDTPEPSSISLVSSNTSNNDAVEVVQESNQVKVITRRSEWRSTCCLSCLLAIVKVYERKNETGLVDTFLQELIIMDLSKSEL